jgi:hypothetical protein
MPELSRDAVPPGFIREGAFDTPSEPNRNGGRGS